MRTYQNVYKPLMIIHDLWSTADVPGPSVEFYLQHRERSMILGSWNYTDVQNDDKPTNKLVWTSQMPKSITASYIARKEIKLMDTTLTSGATSTYQIKPDRHTLPSFQCVLVQKPIKRFKTLPDVRDDVKLSVATLLGISCSDDERQLGNDVNLVVRTWKTRY